MIVRVRMHRSNGQGRNVNGSLVVFHMRVVVAGGVADVRVGTGTAAMTGVHLLIGLGEAAITVAVVGAVLAARPDLVHAAGHLRRPADLAGRPGLQPACPN